MDSSLVLMNAHIQFLETQLALIHIPLELYSNFLQPILQLLLPTEDRRERSNTNGSSRPRRSWAYEHPFVNISVTPIECSVVCSRRLAQDLFVPARDSLDPVSRDQVSITLDDYVVMQVDGEGLDAGQRVLELTSPLAMAGISIFFITTYFADYILVPLRARSTVISALEQRGFAFESDTSSYSHSSHPHHRQTSSTTTAEGPPPRSPPPATISELQTRTFATLKKRNVVPKVDPSIRLIQCAGRKDSARHSTMFRHGSSSGLPGMGISNGDTGTTDSTSVARSAQDRLRLGLVKCLITLPQPRFLSLTLTDTEPASLLLEKNLLPFFDGDDVLLGSKDDYLIPITLDLRDMPVESTGIVCGIAGRLVGEATGGRAVGMSLLQGDMSYLSTARAGTVMVGEDELDRAIEALRAVENGAEYMEL